MKAKVTFRGNGLKKDFSFDYEGDDPVKYGWAVLYDADIISNGFGVTMQQSISSGEDWLASGEFSGDRESASVLTQVVDKV